MTDVPTNPAHLDALYDQIDATRASAHLVLASFGVQADRFLASTGPMGEVTATAARIVADAATAAARRSGSRLVPEATRDWTALNAAASATGHFFAATTRDLGLDEDVCARFATLGHLLTHWLGVAIAQVEEDPVGAALRHTDAHRTWYGTPDPLDFLNLDDQMACLTPDLSYDDVDPADNPSHSAHRIGHRAERRAHLRLVR